MSEPSRVYRCETCARRFPDEAAIRAHQDLYSMLHKIDAEIDEHDGQPWTLVTPHVLAQCDMYTDLVADMATNLRTLVFERPETLNSLGRDVRRLMFEMLLDDPERAFEFNKRYAACVADGRLPQPGDPFPCD
jgi:hypothetical protein